jgi:hypothetical protein
VRVAEVTEFVAKPFAKVQREHIDPPFDDGVQSLGKR